MEKNADVLQLHFELDLYPGNLAVLKKYGKAERGISRDVLVPADMTLHALHYVIQAAFGWGNNHLHSFQLPQRVFKAITGETAQGWEKFCGLYFNSPDSDNMDRYWDDDYEATENFSHWLKKKMKGPYRYFGVSEHFLEEKRDAEMLLLCSRKRWKTEPELRDLYTLTMQNPKELLERLPVSQVLFPLGGRMDKRKLNQIQSGAEKNYADFAGDYFALQSEIATVEEQLENGTCKKSKAELVSWALAVGQEIEYIINKTDSEVVPVTNTLKYSYDYGDGWEVTVQCTDAFYGEDCNSKENTGGGAGLQEQICTVLSERRPVCIKADGLSVMDDVGGIDGYCSFLCSINGEPDERFENAEEALQWAEGMDWTGKMIKPEKML